MVKILIVDDEPKICELIAKYAAFEGYETETAADGMQAVQLCRQNDYDLIITGDLGVYGMEILKEYMPYKDDIFLMRELAQILNKKRVKNGSINFGL